MELAGATIRKIVTPLMSNVHVRWGYPAVLLALALTAIILIAVQSYRTIDRELTDVALMRRASVANLAAATLSEKFARLVDIAFLLTTRPRVRELVAEEKWAEASEFLRAAANPGTDHLFCSGNLELTK